MTFKKLYKAILFPHISVLLVLLPVATVLLIQSMVFVGVHSIIAYVSYTLSAYTLTIWCVRLPNIIASIRKFRHENALAQRWFSDAALRVRVALYGALLWNTAYAVFQLALGFYHASFWFYSLAAYYICLAVMRFSLVRYTDKHQAGAERHRELVRFISCGWVFLLMNLAVALMIFFMVYFDRTFVHHEITTIAMAAYTFTALTLAIIDIVRYRKYRSPVYTATKMVSLAAACVSMLTLETTMLTTFEDGTMDLSARRLLLSLSGAAISAFIIGMAIYMILIGTKQLIEEKKNVKEE